MRAGDDHRPQRVRQDVAHHQAQRRGAQRARRLDELLLAQRRRTARAPAAPPVIQRKPPITDDDQNEDADLRPEQRRQRVAKQVDDQQQHRQLRQRQEQVDQPHQRGVDAAARDAGDRADEGADDDGDRHRREADRERDPPAIQHARQQILAEIVGAERMRPADGPCSCAEKSMSLIGTRHSSGPNATARIIASRITALTTASRWRRKRRHASRPGRDVPRRAPGRRGDGARQR